MNETSIQRRTPAIMIMGTGSNAGKSTIVAGLCRALTRRGLSVRPFKPQNMSNNAAATDDGGEIGRAQAVQAMAARVAPSVHMNPVLLKPESDTGAQVIVQGKRFGALRSSDYPGRAATLLRYVMESFAILEGEADIIVVEGAGSPAETNLRSGDIANMGFAIAADVPVVIAGDIDRGGVIASLVGTHAVLPSAERALIKGFLINKFRGDIGLFDEGLADVMARTSWPSLGVVPWLPDAAFLPAEDAVDLERRSRQKGRVTIATPMLARIANFDDLDPLSMEPSVDHRFVRPGEPLPGDADLIIIPGSKATIADLAFFRAQGWDVDLAAHVRRGGRVLGVCGGYQMLGRTIADPDGVEGPQETVAGLGYLDIQTTLTGDKATRQVLAVHVESGYSVSGYEIHLGRTEGADCARPFARIEGRNDGAISPDGRIAGTYLHGLFVDDDFRRAYLSGFGAASSLSYRARVEQALDALADHLETHLDINAIIAIARQRNNSDSRT